MRGLTSIKARDVTAKSWRVFFIFNWVGVKVYRVSARTENSSTARPGYKRCGCNHFARVIPQTGVTHIIRLIYIQNAAQGPNMIIYHRLKANRAEGRKKQTSKSLNGRGLL